MIDVIYLTFSIHKLEDRDCSKIESNEEAMKRYIKQLTSAHFIKCLITKSKSKVFSFNHLNSFKCSILSHILEKSIKNDIVKLDNHVVHFYKVSLKSKKIKDNLPVISANKLLLNSLN
jgi:hypothetical protein